MPAAEAPLHNPLTWLSYLVLLALADGPTHGYGIIKEVERRTDGRTRVEAGTLYAAIKRLREQGLLSPVGDASGSRRRRDYELTATGRKTLRLESERLEGLVDVARAKGVLPA
ncbi:MAG: PadR family transcriptional regulator [Acidobacteria bacterium]|nr:PadR family transcriptional regulator [Acidobacteriota bacterium]